MAKIAIVLLIASLFGGAVYGWRATREILDGVVLYALGWLMACVGVMMTAGLLWLGVAYLFS